MKVRSGFVSNSSSSSFVLVGWEFPKEQKTRVEWAESLATRSDLDKYAQEIFEKNWMELNEDEKRGTVVYYSTNTSGIAIIDSVDNGAPEGKTLVGIKLIESDEGCTFCDKSWNLDEIRKKLSQCLADHSEMRIFVGTTCS